MIHPPMHLSRSTLVKTLVDMGREPWLGRADWIAVASEMDATDQQARGWYRRLVDWLEAHGHTIEEYAAQETGGTPFRAQSDPILTYTSDSTVPLVTEDSGDLVWEFDQPTTFEEFVRLAQIDLEVWDIQNARSTYWDGRWGWRATMVPRTTPTVETMEKLLERLTASAPLYEVERYSHELGAPCLLQPCIYDAHLEKLFTDGTGIQSTAEAYDYVAGRIVDRALRSEFHIGQVAFVVGNDFGHIDNERGETSAGTRMQLSVGRKAGIDKRIEIAIRAIDRFLTLAPVHVILVPGNHDRDDTYWLGQLIQAWYRNNPRVTVDNGHSPRKFYAWGKSLFMYTHGNEEKRDDLYAIMSAEAPAVMWASSEYREVFNGHLHRMGRYYAALTEEKGVIVRWFPSLSKDDDWHALKGFIGANRGGFGLVYDRDERWVDEFPVLLGRG